MPPTPPLLKTADHADGRGPPHHPKLNHGNTRKDTERVPRTTPLFKTADHADNADKGIGLGKMLAKGDRHSDCAQGLC